MNDIVLAENYQLVLIWNKLNDDLGEEIMQFWLDNKALTDRQQAQKRLAQVVYIIRCVDKKIVAISTAYKQFNQQLENYFYYFRAFVHADHRDKDLGRVLTLAIRDYFEVGFTTGRDSESIGIFLEIENEFFKEHRREAILSDTGFIYIGKNEQGDHLRVYYFDGAQI